MVELAIQRDLYKVNVENSEDIFKQTSEYLSNYDKRKA